MPDNPQRPPVLFDLWARDSGPLGIAARYALVLEQAILRQNAEILRLSNEVAPRQLYVKDHPEANGRTAVKGEHGYTLTFPLQDGTDLLVLCGEETLSRFSDMIGRMLIDNDSENADAKR